MRLLVAVEDVKHLVVAMEHDTVWQVKQRIFDVTDVMPHAQILVLVSKGRERELDNTKALGKAKGKTPLVACVF